MTPFVYKTPVIDMDSKNTEGFFLVKGREDGSWSVHLHHWEKASAGCDTPEACYPAAVQVLVEWWIQLERNHGQGLAVIHSWPENRPGHRPGWKTRELKKADRCFRRTAAAWGTVKKQLHDLMQAHGWPVEIPE